MTIHEAATDFLSKMNPSNWNGCGVPPECFDTRIVTYEIDGVPGYVVDLSFSYDLDYGWFFECEVRDKETEELCVFMTGDSTDSICELEELIKMALNDI